MQSTSSKSPRMRTTTSCFPDTRKMPSSPTPWRMIYSSEALPTHGTSRCGWRRAWSRMTSSSERPNTGFTWRASVELESPRARATDEPICTPALDSRADRSRASAVAVRADWLPLLLAGGADELAERGDGSAPLLAFGALKLPDPMRMLPDDVDSTAADADGFLPFRNIF